MKTTCYLNLKPGTANYLVPPGIQAMMSGVKLAKQDKTGAITLTYTDETTETVQVTNAPDLLSFENFFAVVSFVQSKRLAGKEAA